LVTILRQILNLPVVTKELSRKNQSFTSSPPIYNVIRAAQSLVVLKIVVYLFDLLSVVRCTTSDNSCGIFRQTYIYHKGYAVCILK
jgi:hypothetical protein